MRKLNLIKSVLRAFTLVVLLAPVVVLASLDSSAQSGGINLFGDVICNFIYCGGEEDPAVGLVHWHDLSGYPKQWRTNTPSMSSAQANDVQIAEADWNDESPSTTAYVGTTTSLDPDETTGRRLVWEDSLRDVIAYSPKFDGECGDFEVGGVACTYVTTVGAHIVDVDTLFYEEIDWSNNCMNGPLTLHQEDQISIALHEFGHWIALQDHPATKSDVMSYEGPGQKCQQFLGSYEGQMADETYENGGH